MRACVPAFVLVCAVLLGVGGFLFLFLFLCWLKNEWGKRRHRPYYMVLSPPSQPPPSDPSPLPPSTRFSRHRHNPRHHDTTRGTGTRTTTTRASWARRRTMWRGGGRWRRATWKVRVLVTCVCGGGAWDGPGGAFTRREEDGRCDVGKGMNHQGSFLTLCMPSTVHHRPVLGAEVLSRGRGLLGMVLPLPLRAPRLGPRGFAEVRGKQSTQDGTGGGR